MPYTKTTWINNNEPPISAQNLNKMEQGIYDNSVAVESVTSLLGGHYVQKDVPADAVFTDTTYTAGDNVQINGTVISATDTVYDDTEITNRITTAESDIDDLQESTEHLSDGEVTYPYASEIEIEDALGVNAKDVKVKITAQQDLHGYDKPWVGGAGKNKLPMTVASIKALNTSGTWSGNNYTFRGIVWTILTDDANNVIGIKANQTATQNSFFDVGIVSPDVANGKTLNGCPASGSVTTYFIQATNNSNKSMNETGSGLEITDFPSSPNIIIRTTVMSGYAASNLIFYPMIRASGDATFAPYSNICPISGWDECEIDGVGKNLLPMTVASIKALNTNGTWSGNAYTLNGVTFTVLTDSDGNVTGINANSASSASANADFVVGSMTLENGQKLNGSTGGSSSTYGIAISGKGIVQTNGEDYTVDSTTAGSKTIYIRIVSGNQVANKTFYPMICLATETDPTFEPYQAKTYIIQLGDTIYGGTIDATTGVMTVTHGIREFDGSVDENWGGGTDVGNCYRMRYTISDAANKVTISNYLQYKDGYSLDEPHQYVYNTSLYVFLPVSDSTAFKAYLASNNLQIVYELATPITIQLTPQQIQLLEGYNYLTANTGDIQVTTTDIKGAIGQADELIEANTKAIEDLTDFDLSIFGTVEKGTTASKAYAQGDYFVKNKKMCKALTSIASGATFTLNTNYAAYTLADILKAIEQS